MTKPRRTMLSLAAAGALAGAVLTHSDAAHADVRLGLHPGAMVYVPSASPLSSRNVAGMLRAELNVSLIPWLYLGGYGQLLSNFGDAPLTGGAGATFSVRPTIPFSPIHPFAYLGVGYAGFPGGTGLAYHWLETSLGAGLTAMLSRNFGFEVRAAASKMFLGPAGEASGPFAFTGTVGLTLHL